ncbi:MAG TPA: plasma-membrane proton-efflux P-type ATPase [candidate division Zixibacteria bacterium]|nr:plasma-membrane proton-efflux P-type ATPase [candidate division Zixibacteria bacterium]
MSQGLVTTEDAKAATVDELLSKLSASKAGLSSSEAEKRLQQYGPNEIPEKKANPLIKFLSYFWGPIPWMIEAAVVMSAILQHWPDFGIIFTLLLVNAVVGFWQEHNAGNAIELLKQRLALNARVLRDGKWKEMPAGGLVLGDVVRLRLGDIIPADVKLIEGDYLLTDESALTGESLPVEKRLSDVGYASSIVRQGEMNALVVNTGIRTFFGKTTQLVEEAKIRSHFQKAVVKIGDYLIFLAIALAIVIFVASIFRGQNVLEIIQFVLVLTVAAIPAALPAVLSVTMAIGAIALAKKEAIVSKLVAIEEMAGMDVLCSDKTGTITKNELTIGATKPYAKFKENDVLLFSALASREEDQDPIDKAILAKTKDVQAIVETVDHFKVTGFRPFDPVSKRTEATVKGEDGSQFKVSKGAPQAIMALVETDKSIEGRMAEDVDAFAKKGYRALGVARTDKTNKWQFAGLIALYDPPREDSAKTIKTAQSMGVNVKMVTGDHIAIAKEISRQVGLGTNIVLPESFLDKPDSQSQRVVEEAEGFAEVFPEHKYRIVELLQGKEHIVGMTGDGVNDAPALKKADSGIAVAGATDAAKSAADIVLTKPGLSVIIDAIKESRKIFQRMTNYSIYRIAETIRVLLFITSSIVILQFYPVTPLMIVLLALLNDLPIMTIAYDNVRYSNRSERWDMRTLLGIATFLGIIGVFSSFGILYIGYDVLKLNLLVLQSFIYLKLSVAGHLTVFVARTKGPFWSVKPAKPLLLAVIATQLVATIITVYGILLPAMGWGLAALVWGYALSLFIITDFAKVRLYRLLDRTGTVFHKTHPRLF